MWLKSSIAAICVLLGLFQRVVCDFGDQAKILASSGHIIFESAQDKNITFHLKGRGHLNIASVNVGETLRTLSKILIESRPVTDSQAFMPGGSVADQVQLLATYVSGPYGLIKRVEALEQQ
uniref:Uncharacterized protein n=1 Tax=Anopheles farauti TaxID=69004 RepID=A0A182QEQ2_9DIPT